MNYAAGEDVLIGVLPWFHIYGQTCIALAGLKSGVSLVSMPQFSPELFVKIVKDYKVMDTLMQLHDTTEFRQSTLLGGKQRSSSWCPVTRLNYLHFQSHF